MARTAGARRSRTGGAVTAGLPVPRLGRVEWALLALAALVRFAWASVATTELWFDHVFNDATAWNLAQGNGFTAGAEPPFQPAIFRTPGYPAFLAGVYSLVGHSVRAGFLANALLDTASCAILWRLAAADLGPRTARCVLLLAATYPFTTWSVGQCSPESLLVLLALLFVASVRAWPDGPGLGAAAVTGVVVGALAWIKPVFLPVPAFLFVVDRLRGAPLPRAAARAAIVGVVAAALFAPWLVRNHRAFGRPILAGELGMVVWHGTRDFHSDHAGEVKRNFDRAPADPARRYEAARRTFENPHRGLAADRGMLEAGLDVIRAHPWRAFLGDPLRRIPALWISKHHVLHGAWVGSAAAAVCIAYLALGAAGAWILRARWRDLLPWLVVPVTLTCAYAALHAEARYTLPARPTLLLLGGAALAAARIPAGESRRGPTIRPPGGTA
jgi:hypothetical protein